jgi:hypothetical protein
MKQPTTRSLNEYYSALEADASEMQRRHKDFAIALQRLEVSKTKGPKMGEMEVAPEFGHRMLDVALARLELTHLTPLFRKAMIRDSCLTQLDRPTLEQANVPPGAILDILQEVHSTAFTKAARKLHRTIAPVSATSKKKQVKEAKHMIAFEVKKQEEAMKPSLKEEAPVPVPLPKSLEQAESEAGWSSVKPASYMG